MTTSQQTETFCKAVYFVQETQAGRQFPDDFEVTCEGQLINDAYAATHDTIEDFIKAQGDHTVEQTPFGDVYYWACNKRYGRRGDLFVMDTGEQRFAYAE